MAELDGWGAPEPAADFVDRVVARVEASRRGPKRRRWALAFGIGGVVGAVAVALALGGSSRRAAPPSLAAVTHLQAPGVADVVAEPGARLQWQRGANGEVVLEVVEGVAWVRRAGPELGLLAGEDAVELGSACGRIEVQRGFLSVDAVVDDVDCERVEAAIDRAAAELRRGRSR